MDPLIFRQFNPFQQIFPFTPAVFSTPAADDGGFVQPGAPANIEYYPWVKKVTMSWAVTGSYSRSDSEGHIRYHMAVTGSDSVEFNRVPFAKTFSGLTWGEFYLICYPAAIRPDGNYIEVLGSPMVPAPRFSFSAADEPAHEYNVEITEYAYDDDGNVLPGSPTVTTDTRPLSVFPFPQMVYLEGRTSVRLGPLKMLNTFPYMEAVPPPFLGDFGGPLDGYTEADIPPPIGADFNWRDIRGTYTISNTPRGSYPVPGVGTINENRKITWTMVIA